MKKISLVLISLFVVLGVCNNVLATSVYLLTSTEKQDDVATVQELLDSYSGGNADFNAFKAANPGFEISETITYKAEDGNFWLQDKGLPKVTFDDATKRSGSWNLSSYEQTFYFYTLKAGNEHSGGGFELYWIPEGATSGDWMIQPGNLLNKNTNAPLALSHMSFFTLTVPPTTPVPIPASVVLLAPALFGVVALSRRRKSYGRTNH